MTHLQNKPYAVQQIQNKGRECAITRARFKRLEKMAQPEVYYSDEDDSRVPQQKNQIDKIIHEAQGQIQRTVVKEQPASPQQKSKKTRAAALKKKPNKAKLMPASPVTAVPDMPPPVPIPEQGERPNLPQTVQKPFIGHQISFQTHQQSELNRMERIKTNVDKKFASLVIRDIKPNLFKKNTENNFHFMSEYRAYFQKETSISYQEYIIHHQKAKKKAIASKICQLVKLEKDTKNQLLKKLEAQKLRFRKNASNFINSVIQISQSCNQEEPLPERNVLSAACASNIDQSFSNINQFLASNHTLINDNLPQASDPRDKPVNNPPSIAVSPNHQANVLKANALERRKRERQRAADHERAIMDEQSHQYQIMQTNNNLDLELNKTKDRSSILAKIDIVNRRCEEEDKCFRMNAEKQEREREQKERSKSAKKEQLSSISSAQQPPKNEGYDENQPQKKRSQGYNRSDYYYYQSKTNPKIKRLQILNRYHYNPFQENEGEDQCELWKKLMGMEIKNLKSDNPSIKNEEFNQNLIDQLLKEVEQIDRDKDKLSKTTPNDIFMLHTNYKPSENPDKSKEEEEDFQKQKQETEILEKKTKPIKKEKKKKNKKDKESKEGKESKSGHQSQNKETSHNNQHEIGVFLNLEPVGKIEHEEVYPIHVLQPKLQDIGNYPQQYSNQYNMQQQQSGDFQSAVNQIIHTSEPMFNYDQLADLQGFDVIKRNQQDDDDEPLFECDPHPIKNFQYFENLASKTHQ